MPIDSEIKNAVLVGIQLPKVSNEEFLESLQELTRLVTTLGYNVIGQVVQKRNSDRSATLLGQGKLEELSAWTGGTGQVASMVEHKLTKAAVKWKEAETKILDEESTAALDEPEESEEPTEIIKPQKSAQIVIVDTDLSPSQIRNLESACAVTVLDRTGVIIEIFSRHARTKAARLQVEIAKLTYLAPRLRESSGGEDRQGGGVGGKGSGETSLELDKRRIRDRIKELKSELASIGNEQDIRRARRDHEISVALVGYTNAGKSSLMRALTGSEVLVADKLFATLDTTIRPMHPETRPKILLSDTVGFIKKLPHDLVASFKSTLDEALHASLLLYVVDSSDPSFRSQLQITQSVLKEVGASATPSFIVLNKRDRLSESQLNQLRVEFPNASFISTRDSQDLQLLRDRILSFFEQNMIEAELLIPYISTGIIGDIRKKMRVLSESHNEKGTQLKVRAAPEAIAQVQKKLLKSSDEKD